LDGWTEGRLGRRTDMSERDQNMLGLKFFTIALHANSILRKT
jgi:hypothetical protein